MKTFAKWICSPDSGTHPVVTFRKKLTSDRPVRKVTIRATAMGIYACYLNGARVGNAVLTPGWTSYHHRIQVQTYDVTDQWKKQNTLEFGVAPGWATGYIGYANTNHFYADHTSLLAAVEIRYADGTVETVPTDADWEVYTSHVLNSEIYHGETVDLTSPIRKLCNAVVDTSVHTHLIAQQGEDITEHERLAPIALIHTPAGETVLDFGQNLTGYVEIRITGPRGGRIVLHHAEVLDRDGNFYTANLRAARNENIYVLDGKEDLFKPTYSFQGFRYIQLVEYPFDEVDLNCFRAVVVHSEIKRTGSFVCGNADVNQLYHNIIWGQKSNYLDIPTDCPQRDERLGWTGDAEVFCRTAAINYDVEKFFLKWLDDVALEQEKDGAALSVVPACLPHKNRVSAAWGDVACVAPMEMYLAYGNKAMLRRYFPMMKKWVNYMHHAGPEEFLWLGGEHYGDWLAMDAPGDSCGGATSHDLIASAFFAHSTDLLIRAGEILGEDVSAYRALYAKVVEAFRAYFMENGMPKEKLPLLPGTFDQCGYGLTQTALVLILRFGLCTESERPALEAKLEELIEAFGGLMSTGFVGTPHLLHVLTAAGKTDLAYRLLLEERSPSWLFSVKHGATTMWEHWNSMKEDGSFWSTAMNSFNHYAYGAVYDWMFGVAAGIQPTAEAPAYREITLEPHPDRRLGFLVASIDSRNGTVRSHWYYKGDTVYYEFEIPAASTAKLRLPSGYTETLSGGTYHFAESAKS